MMQNAGIDIVGVRELDYNWKGQFEKKKGGVNYMVIGKKRSPTIEE